MPITRSLYLFAMPVFLVGFGLGGLFGIKDSVSRIGPSLLGGCWWIHAIFEVQPAVESGSL